MAANAWTFYYVFKEAMADGTIDLDGDTFKVLLTTSSYTPSASSHSILTDITNEVSGNGYAQYTLTCTWTRSDDTVTFDSDDATFTADGGTITARYAVLYDSTTTTLVAYTLLDNTPADVAVTAGNTLTISMNESGIFQLS